MTDRVDNKNNTASCSMKTLPVDDCTPAQYMLPIPSGVEIFIKRPLRRLVYPAYKIFIKWLLAKRFKTKCTFSVDQWLWGQRGNDFEFHRRHINKLFFLQGKRLLIAGCGTGRDVMSWLPYRPESLVCVDYFRYDRAWAMLRQQAAIDYPEINIEFVQSDLSFMKRFADSSFDLIGTDAVFEHVRNLPEVLNEFFRLLRPGGIVYATFGPLWYCWGGDHISGYDAIASGYNHLVLSRSAYAKYLDTLGTFSHSEHDGRTWIKNGLFSYMRPTQYIEAMEKAGFHREYVALIIEPRAIKCLSENSALASKLLNKHDKFDLIVTGMTIIYRKPHLP